MQLLVSVKDAIEAAAALEQQARDELRSLTDEEAAEAADQLLALATPKSPAAQEAKLQGLIERQRILYGIP